MAWLRWLAVLPGAFAGGLLSTIPLHLVLYSTLTNLVEPYPETPERILTPLVIAAVFVWLGARIAPTHRVKTSIVLCGLWLLLIGGFVFLASSGATWMGRSLYLQGGGVAAIMGAVGAILGLYLVRKQERPYEKWVTASRRDTPFDLERLAYHRSRVDPKRYEAALTRYKAASTTFEPLRVKLDTTDIKKLFDTILVCDSLSDDEKFEADMALMGLLDGIIPSAEGLGRLKTVFGTQFADAIGLKADELLGREQMRSAD